MFSVNELLAVTKGKFIQGKSDIPIRGISIDSRTIRPQEAFIAIKGSNFDGRDFIEAAIQNGASCIIRKSQPKSFATRYSILDTRKTTFIEVKDTIKALGDIACFQRKKYDIPVIAITGTNGKTTAKEMIAWVLSKKYRVLKNEGTKNNQIGLPMTLLDLDSKYDIVVLELGTNHFGEIDYLAKICLPNAGIITNIGPSHLEYFKSLAGILKEKYSLIDNLKKPYLAFLNADDVLLRKKIFIKTSRPFILGFGVKNKSDFFASGIKNENGRIGFFTHLKYKFTLNTFGYYNIYNALVAVCVARVFGLSYADIQARLATFDFPKSRLNLIKLNKINFIDDTYNSNPLSLKEALDTLKNFKVKGRKIFIMGDMLELGDRKEQFHSQAGYRAARVCDVFITVGELSKLAAKAAQSRGFNVKNLFTCESTQKARDILFSQISPRKEDVVLVKGSRAMKMEEVF